MSPELNLRLHLSKRDLIFGEKVNSDIWANYSKKCAGSIKNEISKTQILNHVCITETSFNA